MILSLRYEISIGSGQERDGFQLTAEVRHLYILIIIAIDAVDWSFIDNSTLSLQDKYLHFQSIMENATCECIPVSYVKFSASDKPWITPVVKDLINKRWSAFRRGDFAAYNHFKVKVQSEIHLD